jgi:uncharacterized membrane protein
MEDTPVPVGGQYGTGRSHGEIGRIAAGGRGNTAVSRDRSVDLLRGCAIVLMIGANTVPYLLLSPAPGIFRLLASLAAPLFILLSGMMVALSVTRKKYGWGHFFVRGGLVLAVAAVLDGAVWGFVPFLGMDVLYLIGIALPLTYLFLQGGETIRRALIAGIFCSGPVFWYFFGYTAQPIQIPVALAAGSLGSITPGMVAGSWLFSGWFPVIPWLGFAFLGAELGVIRWRGGDTRSFATPKTAMLALGCICCGTALLAHFPGPHFVRFGYIEIFYPATPGFCIGMAGLILALFGSADLFSRMARYFDPLLAMGECSLALYIIHITIIAGVIAPAGIRLAPLPFLICTGVFIAAMCGIAYLLRYVRKGPLHRLMVVRFLTG